MNASEVKKYSKGLVNSIKSGKITLEEAVIESSTKTGCTKDYARKILNDYLKSGYSNNPDYVGDWFGKGQIDFNAIINPEDDGDVWMVKMWSGSGYTLDVYLCKATNFYDAIDTVFEWSWENEGENNMVFDLDYVYNEADEYFESDPDMYGNGELDKEEYEAYFIQDQYVGDSNYGLFARSENFFVDKVPENVLAENQKPVQNSRKSIKSGNLSKSERQEYRDFNKAEEERYGNPQKRLSGKLYDKKMDILNNFKDDIVNLTRECQDKIQKALPQGYGFEFGPVYGPTGEDVSEGVLYCYTAMNISGTLELLDNVYNIIGNVTEQYAPGMEIDYDDNGAIWFYFYFTMNDMSVDELNMNTNTLFEGFRKSCDVVEKQLPHLAKLGY